jgi:hypothetical protein
MLFQHLFTDTSCRLVPCPFPLLQCTFSNPPLLLCARFQFSVYFSVWGFFWGESVCPGGYVGLSQGLLGEFSLMLGAHLFDLPNVSQAGLEPEAAVMTMVAAAAHLLSQCNVAWRSFLQARGSGCRSFDSAWCFISTKCGSSVSAGFWSHGAHAAWLSGSAFWISSSEFILIMKLEW